MIYDGGLSCEIMCGETGGGTVARNDQREERKTTHQTLGKKGVIRTSWCTLVTPTRTLRSR